MGAPSPALAPARFDETFLRKLERLVVVSKRVSRGGLRGERRTRRSGAGLEFADHREYAPGDDLRRLDWNVFGRLERPLVRLFEEDEDLPLYLLIDASGSMGLGTPPKLGLAVEVAAALGYVALANLDRVGAYALGETLGAGLGPQRGKGHLQPLFALLSSLRAGGRTSLGAAVDRFVSRHGRRGVVVLLSDFFDPAGWEEPLDRLRYNRFEPVVVAIAAPDEQSPPLDSDVVVVDVETGAERDVTVTPAVRAAYRQRFAARQATLQRFCRRWAVPCFQVGSDQPFDDIVLRLFRGGGLLG